MPALAQEHVCEIFLFRHIATTLMHAVLFNQCIFIIDLSHKCVEKCNDDITTTIP